MSVHFQEWVSGQDIPSDAIQGGNEKDGQALYIARVTLEDGSSHTGKIGETTGRGALIPYGGAEKYFGKCEILVGDSNSVRWEDRAGYPSFEGFNIVEGGKDHDGQQLAIARADFDGFRSIGKVGTHMNGANIGFSGKEEMGIQQYQILVHN